MVSASQFKHPVDTVPVVRVRLGRVSAGFAGRAVRLVAAVLALIGVAMSASPAAAQYRDPAYAEFYDTLDPHGQWIEHPRYGGTWVPYAGEDRNWRPYSRGQWVYTEEHGWYWESEEEFGWVVYHYGRWLLDQRHGWMWVPGHEWGPAWVAWREGDEAVGWAPLPPEAEFDGRIDGSYTFDTLDQPRYAPMWMFVAPAMLAVPGVYRHFYAPNRSSYYFGRSRFSTFYSFRDRRVFNRGIDPRFVERHSNRPVPVMQIRPMNSPRDPGARRGGAGGGAIGIYRPQLAAPTPGRGPQPGGAPSGGFGQRGPGTFGAPGPVPSTAMPSARTAPGFPQGPGVGGGGRPPFGGDGSPRTGNHTPPPAAMPQAQPPQFQPPHQPPGQMPPPGGFGGGRNGGPPMGQPSLGQVPQARPQAPQMPPRPQVQAAPVPPAPHAQKPLPPRPGVPQPPPDPSGFQRGPR
jgi:hypothetical protein